jgi:hypothetical protein
MRRPETVPQLRLVVRKLDEPKQDTTSPKKRKQRAVSGAPNQVLAWTGFRNDHDMEIKRRKLEQAEDQSAYVDAAAAGDIHRLAHHMGVAAPSVEQDVKTMTDALRMLLKCVEKVEHNDQEGRDLVCRLSGPVMAAIAIIHEKQLSELKHATGKMHHLNDTELPENKSRDTRQAQSIKILASLALTHTTLISNLLFFLLLLARPAQWSYSNSRSRGITASLRKRPCADLR